MAGGFFVEWHGGFFDECDVVFSVLFCVVYDCGVSPDDVFCFESFDASPYFLSGEFAVFGDGIDAFVRVFL